MAPGVALLLALAALARCAAATPIDCDVVIVGGSTAAFAAAIASASEKASARGSRRRGRVRARESARER
jgi:hypothetical protein